MRVIDRRIGLLFLTFLCLLVIAVARAAYLGAVRAGSLQQVAATQQGTKLAVPAARGTITDRNGIELAFSQSADDIAADPYLITDPVKEASQLAPLLGVSQMTLLEQLSRRHTGFVVIARRVPAATVVAIKKLHVAGLTMLPTIRRVYPRSWSASQVLGTIHSDGSGASGIEYGYNSVLGGHAGIRDIVNDAIGQPISIQDVRPMQPGKTVQLTLDAALQGEMEQVLEGVGAQYSPHQATAIAMDPNTGEILALANWPRINANDPAGAPPWATENFAVGFNYEPGSTFKAITVAGALQDGLITPDTRFDIPPTLRFYDRTIHDAEDHGYETLSVADILRVSSNIGADEIGGKLGPRRFDYWVRRFGFGRPTGVDLPGEQQGIVLPYTKYSGSSMGNLPMGQGESVTPMQMVAAYAAIANGGILRAPYIVKAIGGKATPVPAGHRIISRVAAAEMRSMLQGVFADGGTASGAEIPGWSLAGKTGTANVVVGNSYSKTLYIASFIGFAPVNHPRLLVAVIVDEPQGSIFGGSVAAPAFQKIVGWAVPYLGIPKN